MNRAQKLALAAGTAVFAVWGLWPPTGFGWFGLFIGYPNRNPVDRTALAIGWVVITVVTAAAVLLLAPRRDEPAPPR
jgi:hypothetical protein